MQKHVLTIPETSPTRYLSGIVALNILSDEGTGDWHQGIFFEPRARAPKSFLAGEGRPTDTVGVLGTRGVYDCARVLDRMRVPHPPGAVYAADHARAIADLVLSAVKNGRLPTHVVLDEWMPRDRDKVRVMRLLRMAEPNLAPMERETLHAWMRTNHP